MAGPKKVTEITDTTLPHDAGDAVTEEARRRARLGSADTITYVLHVIKDEKASTPQRVRCSSMALEVAGLLKPENRSTGLFDTDAGDSGANGRVRSGT